MSQSQMVPKFRHKCNIVIYRVPVDSIIMKCTHCGWESGILHGFKNQEEIDDALEVSREFFKNVSSFSMAD